MAGNKQVDLPPVVFIVGKTLVNLGSGELREAGCRHSFDRFAILEQANHVVYGDSGEFMPDPEPWWVARVEAVGSRGPEIPNGWTSDGGWTPNCLGDAFRAAATALRERVTHYGQRSDAVHTWVDAQDAVFSNCGAKPVANAAGTLAGRSICP